MDPDPHITLARAPIDDAALATIVRDVAADWQMPPQRLDDVTWRERVARPGGTRGGGGTGSRVHWTGRLLGAAVVAVAATVSLAFVAVWLTGPRGSQGMVGATTSAGASASPGASSGSPSTPLPQVVLVGDLPDPVKVMVGTGGRFALADLSTGTLAPPATESTSGQSTVLARPGSGWVCICSDWTQTEAGAPNGLQITLDVIDAAGVSVQRRVLKQIEGAYDPDANVALQPQLVDARATATPDGRHALIAWTRRDGAAGWVVGADVLDLASLETVGSTETTLDEDVALDGRPRTRVAPIATMSPSGQTVLLSDFWYVHDDLSPRPPSGKDHWVATFDDGAIGALTDVGATSNGGCDERDSGLIDDPLPGDLGAVGDHLSGPLYFIVCASPSGSSLINRIGADGRLIDETALPGTEALWEGTGLTTRTKNAVFIWDAVAATMTRFDLDSREVKTVSGKTAAAPEDVIDVLASVGRGLGRWLAPTALAKVQLQPGLVASPDGTRVFGLGIASAGDGGGGSTGVFAFDASTLEPLGTWAPTADLSSLGVGEDGRFVYAAAEGGIAADGTSAPDNGASITAYDASTGEVRLLAGQLGSADLWFPEEVLR